MQTDSQILLEPYLTADENQKARNLAGVVLQRPSWLYVERNQQLTPGSNVSPSVCWYTD